jgi:cation-transporting ATPase 13A1
MHLSLSHTQFICLYIHPLTLTRFEGSTTWQRIRNLKQLKGLAQKSEEVRVFRCRQWASVPTEDLLPGDIISLRVDKSKGTYASLSLVCGLCLYRFPYVHAHTHTHTGATGIVPCDCLLLRGQAVVNEASMTGESVPQMKEAAILTSTSAQTPLDMENEHKMHVLYSGTTLTKHSAPPADKKERKTEAADEDSFPACPEGGCVAYVLRTGFASSQGKLVRMIEYSSEKVMSDVKETMALLFLLLVFALLASGYVMKKGLEEGRRTKYDLILRCVLIITSVVPPELPMQTAVAVNTALMALHKASVFCTEPFRIPYAGRVDVTFFDKTGTLTADELQTRGTANFNAGSSSSSHAAEGGMVPLTLMGEASPEIEIVLGACHSLVDVDGKVTGDPIEMAALKAVAWRYDSRTQIATNQLPTTAAAAQGKQNALENKSNDGKTRPAPRKEKKEKAHVQLLHRYHFSSKLQRMSVLGQVKRSQKVGGVAEATNQAWCISKGSPEAIKKLLRAVPAEYDDTYAHLAENGYRVLALAHRELTPCETAVARNAQRTGKSSPREEVETDLVFAGFVAFSCRVRRDTTVVIRDLLQGSMKVVMVTGDAALTALHVAVETGIARCSKQDQAACVGLLLHGEDAKSLEWRPARRSNSDWVARPFDAAQLPQLAEEFDLVVTGKTLGLLLSLPESHDVLQHICVYARCSPADKEDILRILKGKGHHTLMCGDGANDVGALKQAHIGLALLSGFGQLNVGKEGDQKLEDESEEERKARVTVELNNRKLKAAQLKKDRKRIQAEMKEYQARVYQEEVKRMEAAGEGWAAVKAVKTSMSMMMEEQKRRLRALGHRPQSLTGQASAMAAMEDMETSEMPVIKLGDASVAAPFTSKLPSIKSAVDIIRQGRCTLVSTIQMQQILALNCLIAAYSLSAMYLDNVRSGEKQMIASGVCLMVASVAFSYARPVQELSPVKPITTIFHPAIWVSTAGQLLIHLACMVFMVGLASSVQNGPDERYTRPDIVKSRALVIDEETGEEVLPPFQPTLLNTVVWLVETAQQVSVMAVNYKGRPFRLAATENKSMLLSLLALTVAVFVAAYEVVPELNEYLQLVTLPDAAFRSKLLSTLAVSVFGSFLWDRLCALVFARELLVVGTQDAIKHLPTLADMRAGAGKYGLYAAAAAIVLFADVSPFMLMGLYWLYKKATAKKKEEE